jgi:hypothetical protein
VVRRHQRAMLLVWPVLLAVAAGVSAVPGWAGVGPVVCLLIGAGATGVLAAVFTLSAERALGPAGTPGDPADEVRNPVPRPAPLAGWIVLGWASGQAAESFLYSPIIDLTSILETAPALLCLSGALVALVILLALRPRPSTAR